MFKCTNVEFTIARTLKMIYFLTQFLLSILFAMYFVFIISATASLSSLGPRAFFLMVKIFSFTSARTISNFPVTLELPGSSSLKVFGDFTNQFLTEMFNLIRFNEVFVLNSTLMRFSKSKLWES